MAQIDHQKISNVRVLHLYKTSLPSSFGGVEQVIDQIGRGLSARGVQVDVLALTGDDKAPKTANFNGYTLHREKSLLKLASTDVSFSVITRYRQLAERADVIHYHFPWPFMDLVHFSARANTHSVVTYHSDIIRQKVLRALYTPVMHKFLGQVDRIVATSPNYLATSSVLKKFENKTSVIPIGVDAGSQVKPSKEILAHWQRKFGDRFFLFVGQLRYYKGLRILIEAARKVDYPVVIVGAGPMQKEIEAEASKFKLKNVHFLGSLSEENKAALLKLCYAVVHPSNIRSEAFGVSLLEGAMNGKPMISSEIGTGTTFVNIKDETGMVVPPNDPGSLAQAMQFLWANPDKAVEMGARANRRQQSFFRSEQMVDSYLKLYRDLVAPEAPVLRNEMSSDIGIV